MGLKRIIEKKQKEKRRKEFKKTAKRVAIATASGITAGIAGGILIAPKPGKETRESIVSTASKVNANIKDKKEKVTANMKEAKERIMVYIASKRNSDSIDPVSSSTTEENEA